jgi:hypothetical protein
MGQKIKLWPKTLMLGLLKLYHRYISPMLGHHCRFEPSCSVYAMACLQELPFHKAIFYILRRLLKCHPWHPGGYDPLILASPEASGPQGLKTMRK